MSLEYIALEHAIDVSLIWVRGIRDEYHSSRHVDLRESIIHQQHRIVHIIVIYVFCTLLKLYQH